MTELAELRREYNEIINSMEWAFAMGHGCSVGWHPRFVEVRQRANDLRARIKELEV